jgi:hypothetical protein
MTLLIFYLNQSGFTNQRINLPFSGQDQKRWFVGKEQPESRGLIDYRKEKKFNMNMNT